MSTTPSNHVTTPNRRRSQRILLRNTETLEEQFARVIHVIPAAEGNSEVGVEFLRPAPKFWRISFPPDDWIPHDPEITADTF